MGTPGYMALEQARGEVVDARADVFALGSILAAILMGQPAFVGTTVYETISEAASSDLTDVQATLDACRADTELLAIARRCLAAHTMTDTIVENQMARGTTLTGENKQFLRTILTQFEVLVAVTGDDAESRAIRAEGYFRVGLIRHRLSELREATRPTSTLWP